MNGETSICALGWKNTFCQKWTESQVRRMGCPRVLEAALGDLMQATQELWGYCRHMSSLQEVFSAPKWRALSSAPPKFYVVSVGPSRTSPSTLRHPALLTWEVVHLSIYKITQQPLGVLGLQLLSKMVT